ncbi:hypothetical protein F383_23878 [Gossypium arboreum]|uniref:Uncharacterized protein n=1 Tax=Gossypium arboreum TaxID=29729 RepID=A0A0B0P1H7_GOSAR|nr:hypothetical protein F383_23878 [Gossypium arboreum]
MRLRMENEDLGHSRKRRFIVSVPSPHQGHIALFVNFLHSMFTRVGR